MDKIFISYRRADSPGIAGRVYDRLVERFGRDAIFMDVDSIPPGIDFRPFIVESIKESTLLLVLIGPRWFDLTDARGVRRLDSPSDPVRFEIETALENGVQVIPVYLGRSAPEEPIVPPRMSAMFQTSYSVLRVTVGGAFELDIELLVSRIERVLDASRVSEYRRQVTIGQINAWLLFSYQIAFIGYAFTGYLIFSLVSLFIEGHIQLTPLFRLLFISAISLVIMGSYLNDQLRLISVAGAVGCWGGLGILVGQSLQTVSASAHRDLSLTSALPVGFCAALLFFGVTFNVSMYARFRGLSRAEYSRLRGSFMALIR